MNKVCDYALLFASFYDKWHSQGFNSRNVPILELLPDMKSNILTFTICLLAK